MRTTIIALIIALTAGTNLLLAAGASHAIKTSDGDGTEFIFVRPEIITGKLAPVTPRIAEFEEFPLFQETDPADLAPVAPAEADFEEFTPDGLVSISKLAPVTPAEADFTE